MKKIIFLSCFVMAILAYIFWSYLTRTHGDQKVSYQESKIECGVGKSGRWKFCVHRAHQGTNGGIAYLLHGRNLDEKTWNDETFYTSMIQEHWQTKNQKPPIIVTVSFGPVWLLAPKNSQASSGLLVVLEDEVVPEIEEKLGPPSYRAVFGESMGGLNSLIAGLATKNIFQRVAALCPSVFRESPFSSLSQLKGAMERTGAEPLVILGIVKLAKQYAGNQDEWDQLDPLKLVDGIDEKNAAEFYISSPLYDKYGSFEGSKELAAKLTSRNVKTQWRPLYGGHCAADIISLADFLR